MVSNRQSLTKPAAVSFVSALRHPPNPHKVWPIVFSILLATGLEYALLAQKAELNSSQQDPGQGRAQNAARPKTVADELRLAERLQLGRGVAKDLVQSAYWYHKAADHGDPTAQVQLGYFYIKGIGVERDPAQSVMWFTRAVGAGSPTAKLNLAVLYLHGVGVRRDPGLAFSLLDQLAEKGNIRAQAYLGVLYQNGLGVRQDQTAAEKWFLKAAKRNSPEGQFGMAVLYSTAPEHEHDFRKAADFLRRSAQAGYVPAMHCLGVLLVDHPEIAQRQPDEALSMLRSAAEAGSWRASAALGLLFRDGRGVSRDAGESLRWLTIAMRQGGPEAETSLRWAADRSRESLTADDQDRLVLSAQSWLHDHPASNSLFLRDDSGLKFP